MPTLAADIDIAIELAHGALAELAPEELPLFEAINATHPTHPTPSAAPSPKHDILGIQVTTINIPPDLVLLHARGHDGTIPGFRAARHSATPRTSP